MSDRDDVARRVWGELTELVRGQDRRALVAEALGMSFGRVKVLRRVAVQASTGRELAQHAGVEPPYVSVMVDDLERRGLVERTPHPTDRRAKVVRATAAGRRAAAQAERLLLTPPASFADLPAEDLAALERILAALRPD